MRQGMLFIGLVAFAIMLMLAIFFAARFGDEE